MMYDQSKTLNLASLECKKGDVAFVRFKTKSFAWYNIFYLFGFADY